MILLDAYALIALFRDERAAAEVEHLLREGDCGTPAVNLAEAVDRLTRRYERSPHEVENALDALHGILAVLPVTAMTARRAGALRAHHYRRRACEVSLADCVLAASAEPGDRIATSDPQLAMVLRAQGIEVVALADSAGERA